MSTPHFPARLLAARPGWQDIFLPTLLAGLLLLAFVQQGLDIRLSMLFFDSATQRFPLERDWWHDVLLHAGVKQAVRRLVLLMWLVFITSLFVARLKPYRLLLLYLLTATLVSASLVATFRNASYQACPFSLALFGGKRPYIGPFDLVPAGIGLGRCSPGGHAASAFSLFPLVFAARHLRRKTLTRAAFWFVMLFGLLLTYVQVARGQHLFSHQIWSALICWYVSLASYYLFFFGASRSESRNGCAVLPADRPADYEATMKPIPLQPAGRHDTNCAPGVHSRSC